MVVITLGQEGPTVGINFDQENVRVLNQWLLKRLILFADGCFDCIQN